VDIVVVNLKNGAEFAWQNVRAGELNSVFVEIADLSAEAERANLLFLIPAWMFAS
jgi:hypothetical protein